MLKKITNGEAKPLHLFYMNIIDRQIKRILIENKISNTIFISYGTDEFNENNFCQPKRVLLNNKPVGGYWTTAILLPKIF